MMPTLTSPGDGPARRDLYRFFDSEGRLLYIGISLNAAARASTHSKTKHWWPDVVRMDVEHFDDITRRDMERVEMAAIKLERPVHNVTGNRPLRAQQPVRIRQLSTAARPIQHPKRPHGPQAPIPDGYEYVQLSRCALGAVIRKRWASIHWLPYLVDEMSSDRVWVRSLDDVDGGISGRRSLLPGMWVAARPGEFL